MLGIGIGYLIAPNTGGQSSSILSSKDMNKLEVIKEYILTNYVDSVDQKQLTERGINGMLEFLDPHSSYIPKRTFHRVNDPLLGSFEGIGIQFQIIKDTLRVIKVIAKGPSEKAGLMDGDRIVQVNDSVIAGIGLQSQDVVKLLKGPKGSKVDLGIARLGMDSTLFYTIVRDKIPTFSIDISFVKEGVGYIKLSSFTATTSEEFHQALKEMKSQGMKKLIIDLRNNSGGYLSAARSLVDELLPENMMMVYTEGLHRARQEYKSTAGGLWEEGKLVILINENSASASEILAGAIQDNDRGLILGSRSFGKGLVQEQILLPDSSSLRLTIAKYYTPSGRCIQRPYDVEKGFEEYYYDHYKADSLVIKDTVKYTTLNGRIVYGGGGILPDSVINSSYDSTLYAYYQLIRKGLIYNYALDYVEGNRSRLKKKWSPESFIESFVITETRYDDFIKSIQKSGLKLSDESMKLSKKKIKYLLKAYIGRDLFGEEVFYPIYLNDDEVYLAATAE